MSQFAPIVVFAYRRPEHLRNTLKSLMGCEGFDESPVIVYCDGARNDDELASVMATREVAQSMLGNRAEYRFSDANLGLASSVISGVNETLQKYGRIIVVEDDLQLSPSFLTFMNRALDRYECEEKVFQVSGYQFDAPELSDLNTAFFLPFPVSWGWATWKRAWDNFDPLALGWSNISTDKALRRRFNLDGNYGYATMLLRQMKGYSDSWAIRWYWSLFKKNGLVLFPPVSLVKNTGFDGSGSHGRGSLRRFSKNNNFIHISEIGFPDQTIMEDGFYLIVKTALSVQNGGLIGKLVDKLRWYKVAFFS